ncbi:hypothetical protein SAMN04488068_2743 [Hydrocarboniphaga daqingensis]|uniref:Uncharacterized protein n=2 Tax=Hydrocarboniphaga daqingensis TaxID=490188 RepID=A0A1M5QQL6_9GAMM|nr:hypothetical protein SAMN04488068_2743 [Hydrocarboniphaga daqingensis]
MGWKAVSGTLFTQWNQRLLETYFDGSMREEEVWLTIDALELDSVGADLGGDAGLIKAVRGGPEWTATNLPSGDRSWLSTTVRELIRHRTLVQSRPRDYVCPSKLNANYIGSRPPTYLPIVAALIRTAAAGDEEGFYEPVRAQLGLEAGWYSTQLSEVLSALSDLQRWTEETAGAYGRFTMTRLGGHRYVGVLKAQCLVGNRDAAQLPRAFAKANLVPAAKLSAQQFQALKSEIGRSYFLTKSLRDAATHSFGKYDEPLSARIQDLVDDWDGTVPSKLRTTSALHSSQSREDDHHNADELAIQICLLPEGQGDIVWQVGLRCPPSEVEGQLVLSLGGAIWLFNRTSSNWTTGLPSDRHNCHEQAVKALTSSVDQSSSETGFLASLRLGDGCQELKLQAAHLETSQLRVFVPGENVQEDRIELWEAPLPLYGPAYILCSNSAVTPVQRFLDRSLCTHFQVSPVGLPQGWSLHCIEKCQALSDADRAAFPFSDEHHHAPRSVRLTGGRSFHQGGVRKYPAYDLPDVELDAPPEASVSAEGLELQELRATGVGDSQRTLPTVGAVKRYRILLQDSAKLAFSIHAKSKDGRVLGSCTLRLSAETVYGSSQITRHVRVDHYGSPCDESMGLSGVKAPERASKGPFYGYADYLTRNQDDLGREVSTSDLSSITSSPIAQFLDTLAQVSSMPYPAARDQLQRLLARGRWRRPSLVIEDLRARGHLEVETNHKGHFVRVHSVKATAYRVPIKTDLYLLMGLSGTLRLEHWRLLLRSSSPWEVILHPSDDNELPELRLLVLPDDDSAVAKCLSQCGLTLHPTESCAELLIWSPDVTEIFGEVRSRGTESLFGSASIVHKLNTAKGTFVPVASHGHYLARGINAQLLCCEDWQTKSHSLYVLAYMAEDRTTRYCFVRDHRWGVWIATLEFGRFLKERTICDDGIPWPITYRRSDRSLFLPELLRLPWVLERVLITCAGVPPLHLHGEKLSAPADGRIKVELKGVSSERLTVSVAYDELISGRWNQFRAVPMSVALEVAQKIGGRLDVIDDVELLASRLAEKWVSGA